MTNADIFIDYFNKIEAYIKNSEKIDPKEGFTKLLTRSKNTIVQRHIEDLRKIAELRNVIVHTEREGEKVIAEPNELIVERIKKLYGLISKPQTIFPLFGSQVIGVNIEDKLHNATHAMLEKSFSQIPVFEIDGSVHDILTNNTIARWLSENLDKDGSIVTDNTSISKVLEFTEFKNNYIFVDRDLSIFDAFDLFDNHVKKHNRNLDAVFITHSGKSAEKLLGIITIEDIGKLAGMQFF